jgi:predicted transcriptional regulator
MVEVDKDKLRHSVLNKARRDIILRLLKKEQNISELQKQLPTNPLNRSTICYHLNILEDAGILRSRYVILDKEGSKGRAARVYSIDHGMLVKAVDAIGELTDELESSTTQK